MHYWWSKVIELEDTDDEISVVKKRMRQLLILNGLLTARTNDFYTNTYPKTCPKSRGTRKQNIEKLLISSWGGNGGVDAVVDKLRDGLLNRGIKSDLIYNDPNNSTVRYISKDVDGFFTFADFIKIADWKKYSLLDFHSCNFTDAQLDEIKRHAPVPLIAHVHGLVAHYAQVEAIENALQTPSSQVAMDLEWISLQPDREQRLKEYFTSWPAAKWQEALLRKADKLVFLTNFTRNMFRLWYPEHAQGDDRELIIGNGSDFNLYARDVNVSKRAEEIKRSLGANSKVIVYSGRITPPKGASDLAKAFDKIKEKYPETKLLLVGEPDKNFGGIDCIFKYVRPEFQKDVVRTGWVKDKAELAAYLKASDALVIPSHHETFSIAALEGMFMGTPVVMGDVDGSHEVYVQPQLAYGTKPGDISRMCQLFEYLFEDPSRARQNALYVQKVVNQKYGLEQTIDQNVEVYKHALAERV